MSVLLGGPDEDARGIASLHGKRRKLGFNVVVNLHDGMNILTVELCRSVKGRRSRQRSRSCRAVLPAIVDEVIRSV